MRPNLDWEKLEEGLPYVLTLALVLAALPVVARTFDRAQVAGLRANAGYVLIDNRTREGVVVDSRGYYSAKSCVRDETRIAAGNRARVRACGQMTNLSVRPLGRPSLSSVSLDVSPGVVVEIRKYGDRLDGRVQDLY